MPTDSALVENLVKNLDTSKFNPSPTYCTESISYGQLKCP
jgi:hypothetical protein